MAELRRRMTRSELFRWVAFARVYPLLEAAAGPTPATTEGGEAVPDIPGLEPAIVQAFVAPSPQPRR